MAERGVPALRVIGRLGDLRRRDARAGEQRLADVLAPWSPAGNREWLGDGVRGEAPFLQVSAARAGSVLAWEVGCLRAAGYVRIGPFWLPARWFVEPDAYRRAVRAAAAHVLSLPAAGPAVYVPKARGELEPLLAAWPWLLLVPTTARLSIDDLILARAWPVHPVGVVPAAAHADGARRSPAEFFFHDLDHARFKLREDLLARGVAIADPYRGGSTFDVERGGHRCVVEAALPHLSAAGWRTAPERAARVRGWLAAIDGLLQRDLAEAARWLLFELVHEKSLPIDVAVLGRALATDVHTAKLRAKCEAAFFAGSGPGAAAVAQLDSARRWLAAVVAAGS